MLSARAMSAGYGSVPVLRAIDLEVRAGEMVALVGANGAGKTTTLLALAGIIAPTVGTVAWLGQTRRAPLHVRARAGMAFMPESRAVLPSLTTRENLELGRGSVADALELAPELEPLLYRRAGLLSGGEQQILCLARVLAAKPKLILADEMSLGLAPLIVRRLLATMRAAADGGAGVLLVEQQVRNVLNVADRAYVLRRGAIVLEGNAADLRSRLAEIEAMYIAGSPGDVYGDVSPAKRADQPRTGPISDYLTE